MNFPPDEEIRRYASYYIRAIGIFREEYKNSQGRSPTEFEQQDFSKMGIIPFGILKQNGFSKYPQDQSQNNSNPTKNEPKPASPGQSQKQTQSGWKSEVLKLLNEFPQNLERKSQSKIKIIKDIPRSEWSKVKEGFGKEGWKYDWKEKVFLISEEMKA